jgi:hypothetical protein
MAPRQSLQGAVILVTALLETAFVTFVERVIAHRRHQRASVADRDLANLLDGIIPEVLLEHEGIDGKLVWLLSRAQAERRSDDVTGEVVDARDARDLMLDSHRLWNRFGLRLALSPAGLDWGLVQCRLSIRRPPGGCLPDPRSVGSKKNPFHNFGGAHFAL